VTTTPEIDPALPWALKAAALLWPTPLSAYDPAGEGARWQQLCDQLPWLRGQDQARLLRAAAWAQGAEHGSPGLLAPDAAPVDYLLPMHPLGG
jgi:hypothetical protein